MLPRAACTRGSLDRAFEHLPRIGDAVDEALRAGDAQVVADRRHARERRRIQCVSPRGLLACGD
jgi:hypothetical protein